MPQYLAPGVYVEEVESGAKPIAAVGTSTAGFIGVVDEDAVLPLRRGPPVNPASPAPDDRYTLAPAGQPQLVTNWEGFRTRFGEIQADNAVLAHAVFGYFNNGGSRCWVLRVAPGSDAAATNGRLI